MDYVFEVTQTSNGGYIAKCLNGSIVTQADSWDELRAKVKDAVRVHCFDKEKPKSIQLRFVHNEVLQKEYDFATMPSRPNPYASRLQRIVIHQHGQKRSLTFLFSNIILL